MTDIENDNLSVLDGKNDAVLMTAFAVKHLAEFDCVVFVFAGGRMAFGEFCESEDLAFDFFNPSESAGRAFLGDVVPDFL